MFGDLGAEEGRQVFVAGPEAKTREQGERCIGIVQGSPRDVHGELAQGRALARPGGTEQGGLLDLGEGREDVVVLAGRGLALGLPLGVPRPGLVQEECDVLVAAPGGEQGRDTLPGEGLGDGPQRGVKPCDLLLPGDQGLEVVDLLGSCRQGARPVEQRRQLGEVRVGLATAGLGHGLDEEREAVAAAIGAAEVE